MIYKFDPQNLSNLAWADAQFGYRNDPLLAAISAESRAKISAFTPQELANTAWAYDQLKFRDPPLMAAISA